MPCTCEKRTLFYIPDINEEANSEVLSEVKKVAEAYGCRFHFVSYAKWELGAYVNSFIQPDVSAKDIAEIYSAPEGSLVVGHGYGAYVFFHYFHAQEIHFVGLDPVTNLEEKLTLPPKYNPFGKSFYHPNHGENIELNKFQVQDIQRFSPLCNLDVSTFGKLCIPLDCEKNVSNIRGVDLTVESYNQIHVANLLENALERRAKEQMKKQTMPLIRNRNRNESRK